MHDQALMVKNMNKIKGIITQVRAHNGVKMHLPLVSPEIKQD